MSRSARTDASWRSARALARVEPTVERLVAEHATSYCLRPFRREQVDESVVRWSIEGEPVIEFRSDGTGPSLLVVHDIALLRPVRRALRSRHVRIEHRTPA